MTCNDVSAVIDWQQDRTTDLHDAVGAAAATTPEPQSADTCYDHRTTKACTLDRDSSFDEP